MAKSAKTGNDLMRLFDAFIEDVVKRCFSFAAINNESLVPVFTGAAKAAIIGNLGLNIPIMPKGKRFPRFPDPSKGVYSWQIDTDLEVSFSTDALLEWTGRSATVDYFTYFDSNLWGYTDAMWKDFLEEFDRIVSAEVEDKVLEWMGLDNGL